MTKPCEPQNRWHKYFHNLTCVVAGNSQCFSRQIGAVITCDNLILSTGYNGPPRGIPRCDQRFYYDKQITKAAQNPLDPIFDCDFESKCPRQVLGFGSSEAIDLCPAVHAEANAIVAAARAGVSILDSTMWLNCNIPCSKCLSLIINSGIRRVVVENLEPYDGMSKYLLQYSRLEIMEYI